MRKKREKPGRELSGVLVGLRGGDRVSAPEALLLREWEEGGGEGRREGRGGGGHMSLVSA